MLVARVEAYREKTPKVYPTFGFDDDLDTGSTYYFAEMKKSSNIIKEIVTHINEDISEIINNYGLEDKKNLYLTDEAFELIVNIANIASERAITKNQTGALSDTLKVTAYKNKLDLLLNKVKAYNILNANQLANEAKDDLDFSAGLSDTPSLKTSHYIKKSNSK